MTDATKYLESEINDLRTKVKDAEAKVETFRSENGLFDSGGQTPVTLPEQQLSDLTRGYDQSKANYDDLLKKKNESAMATSMELLQQGERFRIIDPPSLPVKPDFPNRLKFCGIGLAAGRGRAESSRPRSPSCVLRHVRASPDRPRRGARGLRR